LGAAPTDVKVKVKVKVKVNINRSSALQTFSNNRLNPSLRIRAAGDAASPIQSTIGSTRSILQPILEPESVPSGRPKDRVRGAANNVVLLRYACVAPRDSAKPFEPPASEFVDP